MVGLQREHLAVAIGDEGVEVIEGEERELGTGCRADPADDEPDRGGVLLVGERGVLGLGDVGPAVDPVRDRRPGAVGDRLDELADRAPVLNGNVPRVDAALTLKPRILPVPPARKAFASSMQSPPASAERTRVRSLSPGFARPAVAPRSMCSFISSRNRSRSARVAGSTSPASATRRSSSKAVSRRSRLCDDRIYQVLLC
jgi:hypothetical protein